MKHNYSQIYKQATGYTPFPYQLRLIDKYSNTNTIRIPTGIGKTSAVVLMWTYMRFFSDPPIRQTTPRRLIYCLPMRTLVEQTKENIEKWLQNLESIDGFEKPEIIVLMGGEQNIPWDTYPEKNVIIIGTQDMLLSRALNRGYGMSKYRWPLHLGLLNNDCLWILDEVQLMGIGAKTGLQLQQFRQQYGVHFNTRTIQMSATVSEKDGSAFELNNDDLHDPVVARRITASKSIEKIEPETAVSKAIGFYNNGKKVILILNTVDRAVKIYKEIKKKVDSCLLLHSRFRPYEKSQLKEQMKSNECKIIVSTQVIEAGVDISSDVLITEVAPWSSLVQRFGRCNRMGESEDAKIYWMDVKKALPYKNETIDDAKNKLSHLSSASLKDIESISLEDTEYLHIIRDKDVVDLFDTTSDLSGNEIDISHFIREGGDRDFNVFWRDTSKTEIKNIKPSPSREELCRAPIANKLTEILAEKDAWIWDYYEGKWDRISRYSTLTPNSMVMIDSKSGCYDPELGWDIKSKKMVTFPEHITDEIRSDMLASFDFSEGAFETIAEHTSNVCNLIDQISDKLNLDDETRKILHRSALWHDVGKAHKQFQDKIESGGNQGLLAKAPEACWLNWRTYVKNGGRKYFRHELASALSALENGVDDLTAYLVATHHGKIRLSIRSLPDEKRPEDERLFARGIWQADVLPEIDLGEITIPETELDLSYMKLGQGPKGDSWTSRMLDLIDEHGIYRLAYLEALLKSADERASKGEKVL